MRQSPLIELGLTFVCWNMYFEASVMHWSLVRPLIPEP